MKILRVIHSVNPAAGGPVEGLLNSSRKLLEFGHQVDVVSLDLVADVWVQATAFRIYALGKTRTTFGYSLACKLWLDENVMNYDVVVIHGIWQYHAVAAADACRKHHVPYFVFTHGMLDPWFKKTYPLKHIKKLAYWFFLLRSILQQAKGVIFTTDEERILAAQSFPLYKCSEFVVSYGTAGQTGNIEQQKSLFLNTYPQLDGKLFSLFLSRIHPKKGVDILIEAFARSYKTDKNRYLVIAGPDETGLRPVLQAIIDKHQLGDRVIFTGMLQGDMKWGAYGCADCFVLPSHQENFGIVVAEALSAGLPVLISNQVNIFREVLADNAGLACNDEVMEFTALLGTWATISPEMKADIRNNARQCFLARFEITQAAKSLEQVLQHAKA